MTKVVVLAVDDDVGRGAAACLALLLILRLEQLPSLLSQRNRCLRRGLATLNLLLRLCARALASLQGNRVFDLRRHASRSSLLRLRLGLRRILLLLQVLQVNQVVLRAARKDVLAQRIQEVQRLGVDPGRLDAGRLVELEPKDVLRLVAQQSLRGLLLAGTVLESAHCRLLLDLALQE